MTRNPHMETLLREHDKQDKLEVMLRVRVGMAVARTTVNALRTLWRVQMIAGSETILATVNALKIPLRVVAVTDWVREVSVLIGSTVRPRWQCLSTQPRDLHQTLRPSATKQQKANGQRKEWQQPSSGSGRSWSWTATAKHVFLCNVARVVTACPAQTSLGPAEPGAAASPRPWTALLHSCVWNTAWWTKGRGLRVSLCHTLAAIRMGARGIRNWSQLLLRVPRAFYCQ